MFDNNNNEIPNKQKMNLFYLATSEKYGNANLNFSFFSQAQLGA
jgi:hypothetical protein